MLSTERAANRRTRAIRWQLKRRHARESALPALDPRRPCTTLELLVLPAREIGVLDGRERERRWPILAKSLIQCDQLFGGEVE